MTYKKKPRKHSGSDQLAALHHEYILFKGNTPCAKEVLLSDVLHAIGIINRAEIQRYQDLINAKSSKDEIQVVSHKGTKYTIKKMLKGQLQML